jgi:hypothetical protein
MGVSGQSHAPVALYLREKDPGTHWIGSWVGLRAGLDIVARRKSFASAENRTPVFQSLSDSILTELPQLLSYMLMNFIICRLR